MRTKSFLLITVDGFSPTGRRRSAWFIAKERLQAGYWPIYTRTKNRKQFQIGDEVAFYVGGSRDHRGLIVARSKIRRILPGRVVTALPISFAEEHLDSVLQLDKVEFLPTPIKFIEQLPKLSFCPENMLKWGAVLLGGCRMVDPLDWTKIFV